MAEASLANANSGFLFQELLCLTLALVLAAWPSLILTQFLRLVLLRVSFPTYPFAYMSQSWFPLLTVDLMLMDTLGFEVFFFHFAYYIQLNSR